MMKTSRLFKRVAAFAVSATALALAVLVPLSSAAASVKLEGSLGVANVTAGDSTYAKSVNAKYNEVVRLQVFYHNQELPDSGKVAENLRVKINIPTTPGKVQTVSSKVSADNSNTLDRTATINLDRDDAYLQYIPGSAIWRHNEGGRPANEQKYVDTKLSDEIVYGGTGVVVENQKPCYEYAASITVLARVIVPGVKVVKQSQVHGQTNKWSNDNTAKPGQTMDYMITYQNTGNSMQENVLIRDSLPPKMTLVPGTTKIYANIPGYENGKLASSDNITKGGIYIGSYTAGSGAYVTFQAKLVDSKDLSCGMTTFRNIAVAQPKGYKEHFNVAVTKVTKECKNVPTCDMLTLVKDTSKERTVTATVKGTANGATFKTATFDFGDGKTVNGTSMTATHTYDKDGEYTVIAKLLYSVDGKDTVVTSDSCMAKVNFGSVTPTPTPQVLPATGAGGVVAIFAAVAAAAGGAHYVIRSRKA